MSTSTKILTVTSDQVLMNFLRQGLGDGDFEVVNTEHTGIQLKDIIETEEPEFIILDIGMPALDGIGICLQLRQWTRLPIMMVTTWGSNEGMVRGLNLGSDDYLTEPFGADMLKKRIDMTLKRIMAFAGNPVA